MKPHPEIVAAWQKYTDNPHFAWPCQNFTAGFNAGLAAAHPPTEPPPLTQLQPLVMLKLTDAQAEELKKAMGIESGFDCPPVEATVAGVKYSTPSVEGPTPPFPFTPADNATMKTAGEIADGLPRQSIITELRATCDALRKQTGERGAIITRLRKERDGSRETLKDVADQRDRFRTELAAMKQTCDEAQTALYVERKLGEANKEENAKLCRNLKHAQEALQTALQQEDKECEAKTAALNDAHRERASHRMTESRLRIAEAELTTLKGQIANAQNMPKPAPWNLTDLAELIRNRKAGFITEGQFLETLNQRPLP